VQFTEFRYQESMQELQHRGKQLADTIDAGGSPTPADKLKPTDSLPIRNQVLKRHRFKRELKYTITRCILVLIIFFVLHTLVQHYIITPLLNTSGATVSIRDQVCPK